MSVRIARALWLAGCMAGQPQLSAAQAPPDAAPAVAASSHVLLAAGDIAQCRYGLAALSGAAATAALIDRMPGTVLALGDLAYRDGSSSQFRDCYDPTWGRFKSRTWPVPGNHDYRTPHAQAYFDYWGPRAGASGQGYYAIDVGHWRVIALNSNIDAGPGSEQMLWLAAELARGSRPCTLAFWHHPRFSSGGHGDGHSMALAWNLLSDARADVVLSAHDHGYERLAPLNEQGEVDPEHGIRSFVVGTGGSEQRAFEQSRPGSEVRGNAFGVLALTLHRTEYAWEFVPVSGESFTDRGTGTCRK